MREEVVEFRGRRGVRVIGARRGGAQGPVGFRERQAEGERREIGRLLEREAEAYFDKIDALGGVTKAIEKGFFQREIADAAYSYQKKIEEGKRVVVGVNRFTLEDEKVDIDLLKIDPAVEQRQLEPLARVRAERSQGDCAKAPADLPSAARAGANLMRHFLPRARAYAPLGETLDVLRKELAEYKESPMR